MKLEATTLTVLGLMLFVVGIGTSIWAGGRSDIISELVYIILLAGIEVIIMASIPYSKGKRS